MYNNWKDDLNDSIVAISKIKECILPILIKGKIHSIENSDNEILLLMDRYSGIDYIRINEHGLQGIAARVQWGGDFSTFTIRSERKTGVKTELEKRLYQINNGYFYPAYTLQAYFDNRKDNNLLSIAIIETKYLYDLYINNQDLFESNKSDNDFKFIKWHKINKSIKVYRDKNNLINPFLIEPNYDTAPNMDELFQIIEL